MSMLPEGDVRTVVSSSKTALDCCNGLPLVQVLTVIYITAIVRSVFKFKATISRAWFTVRELSMGCRAWEAVSERAAEQAVPPDQLTPHRIAVLPVLLRCFC